MSVNLRIKAEKTVFSEKGEKSQVPNVLVFPDGSTMQIKQNLTIKFKDSYLFLPVALRKLAQTFRVSVHKGFQLRSHLNS